MSLRRRVTLAGLAVVVRAVGAFAGVTLNRLRHSLVDRTDQELAAIASGLMGNAQQQAQRHEDHRPVLQFRHLEQYQLSGSLAGYAVVIDSDGAVLPLPRLAKEGTAPPPVPADLRQRVGRGPFTIDGRFRALAVKVPGHDSTLFVALTLSGVDETAHDLMVIQLVTGALVVVVCSALLLVTVRAGLRPLGAVTTAAREMASSATPAQIPAGPDHTEIGELTAALNAMLDALQRAGAQREDAQRRTAQFAVDAAHELRTPVTAILGYAELYQHGGIEGEQRLDEVFERMHAEADRLRQLVDDLLVLNRLDRVAPVPVEPEPVDLVELVAVAAADSLAIDRQHPMVPHSLAGLWLGPAVTRSSKSSPTSWPTSAGTHRRVRPRSPSGSNPKARSGWQWWRSPTGDPGSPCRIVSGCSTASSEPPTVASGPPAAPRQAAAAASVSPSSARWLESTAVTPRWSRLEDRKGSLTRRMVVPRKAPPSV